MGIMLWSISTKPPLCFIPMKRTNLSDNGGSKSKKEHLYMGRIEATISVLHKRGVPQLATYFERHKRRMTYLEFREDGLPIGSGTVESGVKQFKQRLSGTGMRWHLDNANVMLVIRSAVLGNDFHNLWVAA
jgi:hypothetical protein